MDRLQSFGTAIADILAPTGQAYTPLLQANAEAIKSTPVKTYKYGPHDRQGLDVYQPTNTLTSNSALQRPSPVLIFLHGGGLVAGAKNLSTIPDNLVYANLGHFFASKYGYTVVIPNYRLMMHGARFPSGGEDLELVIEWISQNASELTPPQSPPPLPSSSSHYAGMNQNRDLYIMGNSAGGVHLSTYLFDPSFSTSRAKILPTINNKSLEQQQQQQRTTPSSSSSSSSLLTLKAAVLLACPLHFRNLAAYRKKTTLDYYGTEEGIERDCPLGLLNTVKASNESTITIIPGVKVLCATSTLDPEEIVDPNRDFVQAWMSQSHNSSGDSAHGLTVSLIQGHNHISTVLALGTGIEKEEEWGHDVAAFLQGTR